MIGSLPFESCESNDLIQSLPPKQRELVLAAGQTVYVPQGSAFNQPGMEIDYLTFPERGMISLLAVLGDGRTIETATIGREGVLGGFGGLGLHYFPAKSVATLPLVAFRISIYEIRKIVRHHPIVREVLTKYVETLLAQLILLNACNSFHSIEVRLCRWLTRARIQFGYDEIPITQEMLAEILGVRRASISDAGGDLEAIGLIRRSRGHITIIDPAGLETASCECMAQVIQQR